MPELLTKHPKIVKSLLAQEGIACGKGATQQILTACPKENFCSLKGGELCVYGLDESNKMTQFSKKDLCGGNPHNSTSIGYLPAVGFTLAGLLIGLLVARLFSSRR